MERGEGCGGGGGGGCFLLLVTWFSFFSFLPFPGLGCQLQRANPASSGRSQEAAEGRGVLQVPGSSLERRGAGAWGEY